MEMTREQVEQALANMNTWAKMEKTPQRLLETDAHLRTRLEACEQELNDAKSECEGEPLVDTIKALKHQIHSLETCQNDAAYEETLDNMHKEIIDLKNQATESSIAYLQLTQTVADLRNRLAACEHVWEAHTYGADNLAAIAVCSKCGQRGGAPLETRMSCKDCDELKQQLATAQARVTELENYKFMYKGLCK